MSTILSTFQCVRTVCDHVHGLTCAGSGVTVPTPHACVSGSHRKHDSRPHWLLNVPFGHGMQPGSTSLPRQSVDACTPTEPTWMPNVPGGHWRQLSLSTFSSAYEPGSHLMQP